MTTECSAKMMMMMMMMMIIIIIIIIIHSFYIALFSSLEQTQCAGISHVILNEWLPFIARIINIHGSGVLVVPQRWLCSPDPPPPAPLSPASLSHHHFERMEETDNPNERLIRSYFGWHNTTCKCSRASPFVKRQNNLTITGGVGMGGGGECRLLICFWYWH